MKYIALEGIDGCGKTTHTQSLMKICDSFNKPYNYFNYSNKNNYFGKIINYLHSSENKFSSNVIKSHFGREVLYSLSARYNLKKIQNNSDDFIISDRSVISAFASHHQKLPKKLIKFFEPNFYPDVLIYLSVSTKCAFNRVNERENNNLRFDESLNELENFKKAYDFILTNKNDFGLKKTSIYKIDTERNIDLVKKDMEYIVGEIIKNE